MAIPLPFEQTTPPLQPPVAIRTLSLDTPRPSQLPLPLRTPAPTAKAKHVLDHPEGSPFNPQKQQVSPPLPPRTTLHLGLRTLRWILLPFLLDLGGARAALVLRHAVEDLGDVLAAAPPGRLLCTPGMRLAGLEEIDGTKGAAGSRGYGGERGGDGMGWDGREEGMIYGKCHRSLSCTCLRLWGVGVEMLVLLFVLS